MCATHWKRSRNLQLSFTFHSRLKNNFLKNSRLLVLLLAAATVLPSCKKTIEGSGNYVDEVRTVGLFSAIESDALGVSVVVFSVVEVPELQAVKKAIVVKRKIFLISNYLSFLKMNRAVVMEEKERDEDLNVFFPKVSISLSTNN